MSVNGAYAMTCNLCGADEEWDVEVAAKVAAVWHVFEYHPDKWLRVVGGRKPTDPRPEEFGSRI